MKCSVRNGAAMRAALDANTTPSPLNHLGHVLFASEFNWKSAAGGSVILRLLVDQAASRTGGTENMGGSVAQPAKI